MTPGTCERHPCAGRCALPLRPPHAAALRRPRVARGAARGDGRRADLRRHPWRCAGGCTTRITTPVTTPFTAPFTTSFTPTIRTPPIAPISPGLRDVRLHCAVRRPCIHTFYSHLPFTPSFPPSSGLRDVRLHRAVRRPPRDRSVQAAASPAAPAAHLPRTCRAPITPPSTPPPPLHSHLHTGHLPPHLLHAYNAHRYAPPGRSLARDVSLSPEARAGHPPPHTVRLREDTFVRCSVG